MATDGTQKLKRMSSYKVSKTNFSCYFIRTTYGSCWHHKNIILISNLTLNQFYQILKRSVLRMYESIQVLLFCPAFPRLWWKYLAKHTLNLKRLADLWEFGDPFLEVLSVTKDQRAQLSKGDPAPPLVYGSNLWSKLI